MMSLNPSGPAYCRIAPLPLTSFPAKETLRWDRGGFRKQTIAAILFAVFQILSSYYGGI